MNTTAAPNPISNVGDFLTRVLPWPKADEPGYVNVHVCGTAQDGKKFWSGTPTRTLDEFLDAAYGARSWKSPPDIYMCLSRQGETRLVNGKVRAAKSQEHALAFKSIWLDIDVGKPDAYPTINDAHTGLQKFLRCERRPKSALFWRHMNLRPQLPPISLSITGSHWRHGRPTCSGALSGQAPKPRSGAPKARGLTANARTELSFVWPRYAL
jgi:hypothetical protein